MARSDSAVLRRFESLALVLIFLFIAANGELVRVVELNDNWNLANSNLTIQRSNVKIPSGVYSVMYGEDVLKSYNDIEMRGIAFDKWIYSRTFTVNEAFLDQARFCNVTFYGIDTVAVIRLNRHVIGRTDNMFVRYSFDITSQLQPDNVLEVEIFSPVIAARERANVLKQNNTVVPPTCPSDRYHGECHVNMLRKMQASFAWDWAPAVPSMGIWKPVVLELYDVAIIRDVDVMASKNDTHWNMHIRAFMDVGAQKDFYAELKFYAFGLIEEPVIVSDYRKTHISSKNPMIAFDYAIPINNIVRWWPNGYGEQKLYHFNFVLSSWLDDNGPKWDRLTISQKAIRYGFRTIELVQQEAVKGNGFSFLFKVNDLEMFMKGTNYVPAHILPELGQDKERIKFYMDAMKEAHMNMVRIWGGGIYESDYFYELADQYGILVWQDMMFANAMYPVTEDFLASVRTEIAQVARRIAYHPCIAIYAANSENELALAKNWFGTLRELKRYENDYRELYISNVGQELKIVNHISRPPPLVSTPSNGKREEFYNYVSINPQDWKYGDVHFFAANENGLDVSSFPTPRFVSEYGFQSLPQLESWKRVLGKGDDLMELMRHRQHHPMAMLPIVNLVRSFLPLPVPKDKRYTEALIYFSQVTQAMATKLQTEKYRSLRDTEHRTMGALYWHLNDVWVAPSWSSIDFYGNYKLLHYWAKDFMAPITVIALYDSKEKTVNVSVACDKVEVVAEGAEITMSIHMWSALHAKNKTSWPVILKPNGVAVEKSIPIDVAFVEPYTTKNSFLEFTLQRTPEVISKTYFFPEPFPSVTGVGNPDIRVDVSWKFCISNNNINSNSYSLKIITRKPAIFVYIEIIHPQVGKYKLSQNGFMQLVPVEKVELNFDAASCIIIKQSDVRVTTVNEFISPTSD